MLWFGLCIQYDSIQNLNGFIYSVPALFLLIREIEKKNMKMTSSDINRLFLGLLKNQLIYFRKITFHILNEN